MVILRPRPLHAVRLHIPQADGNQLEPKDVDTERLKEADKGVPVVAFTVTAIDTERPNPEDETQKQTLLHW